MTQKEQIATLIELATVQAAQAAETQDLLRQLLAQRVEAQPVQTVPVVATPKAAEPVVIDRRNDMPYQVTIWLASFDKRKGRGVTMKYEVGSALEYFKNLDPEDTYVDVMGYFHQAIDLGIVKVGSNGSLRISKEQCDLMRSEGHLVGRTNRTGTGCPVTYKAEHDDATETAKWLASWR